LGAGVIVLPGARIGRNVAVGAGSVVVGELPDHCVAVGVPARVVKRYVADEGWVTTRHRSPNGTNGHSDTTESPPAEGGTPPPGPERRRSPSSSASRRDTT